MKRIIILFAACGLTALAQTCPQVTSVSAIFSNGQAFITWTDAATGASGNNYRYDVYKSTTGAVTSTAGSTLVAVNRPNNSGQMLPTTSSQFTQTYRQDSTQRMSVIPNGSGGTTTLAYGAGLSVQTTKATTAAAWYGVVTKPNPYGTSTCTAASAPASTSSSIAESVQPIKPVLQYLSTSDTTPAAQKMPSDATGYAVWWKLYGSGGAVSAYGDTWVLWGDTTMGHQDGMQSMVRCYKEPTAWGQPAIFCMPTDRVWDPTGNSSGQQYWYGLEDIPPFAADQTSRHIYDFGRRRLATITAGIIAYYHLDSNSNYVQGVDMGGGGALYSMIRSANLAMISGKCPTLWWEGQAPYVKPDSSIATATFLTETIQDGTTKYYDDGNSIRWVQNQPASNPLVPVTLSAGRLDVALGAANYSAWENTVAFINAMKASKRFVAAVWGNLAHTTATDALWDTNMRSNYQTAFRKNVSYPVFTGSSLDDLTGDGTWTSSGPNNGALTGCINCDWVWDTPTDTASTWAVNVSNSGTYRTYSTATVDITPRNPQLFIVAPGTTVHWSASTGQSGSLTADGNGLVTAPGVTITSGSATNIIFSFTAPGPTTNVRGAGGSWK